MTFQACVSMWPCPRSQRAETNPGGDTRETLVLIYQELQLSCELHLLRLVRQNGFLGRVRKRPRLQWAQSWHILDYEEAQLIASSVEQFRLDFDLLAISIHTRMMREMHCDLLLISYMFSDHVEAQSLEKLQVVHHCLPSWRRIDTIRPEALVQGTEHENELSI